MKRAAEEKKCKHKKRARPFKVTRGFISAAVEIVDRLLDDSTGCADAVLDRDTRRRVEAATARFMPGTVSGLSHELLAAEFTQQIEATVRGDRAVTRDVVHSILKRPEFGVGVGGRHALAWERKKWRTGGGPLPSLPLAAGQGQGSRTAAGTPSGKEPGTKSTEEAPFRAALLMVGANLEMLEAAFAKLMTTPGVLDAARKGDHPSVWSERAAGITTRCLSLYFTSELGRPVADGDVLAFLARYAQVQEGGAFHEQWSRRRRARGLSRSTAAPSLTWWSCCGCRSAGGKWYGFRCCASAAAVDSPVCKVAVTEGTPEGESLELGVDGSGATAAAGGAGVGQEPLHAAPAAAGFGAPMQCPPPELPKRSTDDGGVPGRRAGADVGDRYICLRSR